jgi:hypothetical protein
MNQARQPGNTSSRGVGMKYSLSSRLMNGADRLTKLRFCCACISARGGGDDFLDQGFDFGFRCLITSLPLQALTMTFFL